MFKRRGGGGGGGFSLVPLPPQAVVLRGVSSKTIDGAGSYAFSSPLSMLAEQSIDFLKLSVFVGVQSGAYKEDDLRQV